MYKRNKHMRGPRIFFPGGGVVLSLRDNIVFAREVMKHIILLVHVFMPKKLRTFIKFKFFPLI